MNIPTPTADFDVVTPQPTGIEKADRFHDLIASILTEDALNIGCVTMHVRQLSIEDAKAHREALKQLHWKAGWLIEAINELHGRMVLVPQLEPDGSLRGTWHAIDGQY